MIRRLMATANGSNASLKAQVPGVLARPAIRTNIVTGIRRYGAVETVIGVRTSCGGMRPLTPSMMSIMIVKVETQFDRFSRAAVAEPVDDADFESRKALLTPHSLRRCK